MTLSIACPCCGYPTLTTAQNYETCLVCGWVDVPLTDAVTRRAMNPVTLLRAQRNFLAFSASTKEALAFVRPPTADEQRTTDWQPLEIRLRQQQHLLLDGFIQPQPKLFDLLAVQIADAHIHYLVDPADDAQIGRAAAQQHQLDYAAMNQILANKFPVYPPIYDILDNVSHWGSVDGAFACTALLLAANQPQVSSLFTLYPEHIRNLVGDVFELEQTMLGPALHFLCQCVLDLDLERHLPEFSVGILVLAAALAKPSTTDLPNLRKWALQEEQRLCPGEPRQSLEAVAQDWSPRIQAILHSLARE